MKLRGLVYTWAMRNLAQFLLCLSLLGSLTATAADGEVPASGFDKPEATISRQLGISDDVQPPAPRTEECLVGPDFAVVALNDPALMGEEISIRPRQGRKPEDLCSKEAAASGKKLADAYGQPAGVAGPYLVVEAPDVFGVALDFAVYELSSGREIFKGVRHSDEPFIASRNQTGGVQLAYHAVLSSYECPRGDAACWKRFLSANQVPSGKLAAPVCPPGNGPWQVTLPAVVGDLKKASLTFSGTAGTCDPTP